MKQAVTAKKRSTEEEFIDDLSGRLNHVELELIEAKEFSHLSSEVFEVLQSQINEIKEIVESLFSFEKKTPETINSLREYY